MIPQHLTTIERYTPLACPAFGEVDKLFSDHRKSEHSRCSIRLLGEVARNALPIAPVAAIPAGKPVSRQPVLLRTAGTGFKFDGARDHDSQTGTYVTTFVFTLFYVPVLRKTRLSCAKGELSRYFRSPTV